MTDEKKPWRGGRLGPFHLGRRYRNVSARLGRIYEAHNVHTGRRALVLIPGAGANWEPAQSWRVYISIEVTPPHLVLEVERAPGSGQLPELAEFLDLITSGVERVETLDEARAHLTGGPVGAWNRWLGRARRLLRSRRGLALAGLAVLVLGGGLWLGSRIGAQGPQEAERAITGVGVMAVTEAEAPVFIDGYAQGAIAYPLPQKPFRNQAKVPCIAERGEEEINGGCWIELARRPPCHKDHAEYKGKCYLPVSSDRGPREPQAVQP